MRFFSQNSKSLKVLIALLWLTFAVGISFFGYVLYIIPKATGGYAKTSWDGIYSKSCILESREKTVQLIGMAHLASREFYAEVFSKIPKGSIVLEEGAADSAKLLPKGLEYKNIGFDFGSLTDQKEFASRVRGSHKTVNADIDIQLLKPKTIRFLKLMSQHMAGEKQPLIQFAQSGEITLQFLNDVLVNLVQQRNDHLLEVFNAESTTHSMFTIPWGILHMGTIESEFIKNGYK